MNRISHSGCVCVLFFLLAGVSGIEAKEASQVASSVAPPKIVCAAPDFDFGRVVGTNDVNHAFRIVNDGDEPLNITRIHAGCGCTETKLQSDTIPAHSATELSITFKTSGRIGPQRKSIYIHSNDPINPIICLVMSGNIVMPRGALTMPVPDPALGPAKKKVTQGDYYAVPEELIFLSSPGKTNPVTRFIAIRSLDGKAIKIQDVKLPCLGNARITLSSEVSSSLVELTNLYPSLDMNGKSVHILMQDGKSLIIPIVVKESHSIVFPRP